MQRSAPRRRPESRGFGAVVPERFTSWRATPDQGKPARPRDRRNTSPDERWRRIGDSEAESVARHASQRRAARAAARQGMLGRVRGSAPRMPRVLEGWRSLGLPAKITATVVVLTLVGGLVLFELPWLKVQRVEVEGSSVIGRSQLLADAGVRMGQSTLTLDTQTVTRNLLALPWVASADVKVQLPGTLVLSVAPLAPGLIYQRGQSKRLLTSTGAILGPLPAVPSQSAPPTLVDQRGGGAPAVGAEVLPSQLAGALVQLARVFPAAYGTSVGEFVISPIGALEVVSASGWTADFGPALTSSQISSLGPKLEALRALGQKVSLKASGIKDIYLEDPTQIGLSY